MIESWTISSNLKKYQDSEFFPSRLEGPISPIWMAVHHFHWLNNKVDPKRAGWAPDVFLLGGDPTITSWSLGVTLGAGGLMMSIGAEGVSEMGPDGGRIGRICQ